MMIIQRVYFDFKAVKFGHDDCGRINILLIKTVPAVRKEIALIEKQFLDSSNIINTR